MRILPKVADCDINMPSNIRSNIESAKGFEIQLLGEDILLGLDKSKKLIDTFNNSVDYVVMHLPLKYVLLDTAHANKEFGKLYIEFLNQVIEYSNYKNIKIDILNHVVSTWDYFNSFGTMELLDKVLEILTGTNVTLLIENSIRPLNDIDGSNTAEEMIFKLRSHPNLRFCFDICHWQSSENAFNTKFSLTDELLSSLKNIHFSATLNGEGYRNKSKTHGRVHGCIEHVLSDIEYLREKQIELGNINIILEINEEDYINRPNLIKEIHLFNQAMAVLD